MAIPILSSKKTSTGVPILSGPQRTYRRPEPVQQSAGETFLTGWKQRYINYIQQQKEREPERPDIPYPYKRETISPVQEGVAERADPDLFFTEPKKSAFEGFVDSMTDWDRLDVPFTGTGEEAIRDIQVVKAYNRFKAGEATEADIEKLEKYYREQERQGKLRENVGYNAGEIIKGSVRFMGELLPAALTEYFTAGVAPTGDAMILNTAAKLGARKTIQKMLKDKAFRAAITTALKGTIKKESALLTKQLAITAPTNITLGTAQRMIGNVDLNTGEVIEDGQPINEALVNAISGHSVELLTERGGGITGKILNQLAAPARKVVVKTAIFQALKKAMPSATDSQIIKIIQRSGWNGPMGEWFEERDADLLNDVLFEVGLGDQDFTGLTKDQIASELIAFMVMGGGSSVLYNAERGIRSERFREVIKSEEGFAATPFADNETRVRNEYERAVKQAKPNEVVLLRTGDSTHADTNLETHIQDRAIDDTTRVIIVDEKDVERLTGEKGEKGEVIYKGETETTRGAIFDRAEIEQRISAEAEQTRKLIRKEFGKKPTDKELASFGLTEAEIAKFKEEKPTPTKPLTAKQALAQAEAINKPVTPKKSDVTPQVSKFITQRESTHLKNRARNIARGYREGTVESKRQTKELQTELTNIISRLDILPENKKKLLGLVKDVNTPEKFARKLEEVEKRAKEYAETELKKSLQKAIDKELKGIKPRKVGTRRISKYDYTTNKLLQKINQYNKLNQEEAQAKLDEMPQEELTNTEKIETRFLSYKANGMQSSAILMEQVRADIEELKRLGEEAKSDADFENKIEQQKERDSVSNEIDRIKGNRKSFITKVENFYRRGFTNLRSMINSIAGKEIADKLDPQLKENRKEAAIFYATQEMTGMAREIYELDNERQVASIFNEMGQEDFNIVDIEGIDKDLTKWDIIDIYLATKNETVKERYYRFYGEDNVKTILTNLSSQDMQFADAMQEKVQSYWDIMNKRHIEIYGRDLGTVENYWPSTVETQQDVYDDFRVQSQIPSALQERSKSNKIIPEPRNAWTKMLKHVAQAEHVDKLSREHENLLRIFKDRKVKRQIQKKYGQKVYDDLLKHIDYLSLNRVTEKIDAVANVYDKLLNNWVKAKIFSPTVFARQLGSVINYTEDMDSGTWMKEFTKGIANPKKTFDFMWENAPFLKARFNRGYSEALKDALEGASKMNVYTGSYTQALTAMVRAGDIMAIIYGGYPVIKSELAKGKTMQEAVDEFETRTLIAQQAGITTSLSHFQNSSNPIAKTFLRFKNTLNQYARKQADAILNYRNGDISAGQLAKTTAIYSIINPMIYVSLGYWVTQLFKMAFGTDDDDGELKEDLMQQLALNPFLVIPVIDDISKYVYRKMMGRPTYDMFNTPLLDELEAGFQLLTKKNPTLEDWLNGLSKLQEPATAFPSQSIIRYYKYATEDKGGITTGEGTGANQFRIKPIRVKPIRVKPVQIKPIRIKSQ